MSYMPLPRMSRLAVHRHVLLYRCFAAKSNLDLSTLPPELREQMHGRKQRERVDSINETILRDRLAHMERIEDIQVPPSLVKTLRKMGFGSKRKRAGLYSASSKGTDAKSDAGAGGHALYVASAAMRLPLFKHLLPEIALAGHSNAGKSTMVNALSGLLPRKGVAGVSERAGWTDQLCFYQLGKKPPLLTLVDMPGYGHAVAHSALKQLWRDMIDNYLTQRPILARCYVLVDCTRGICDDDRKILRTLIKRDISWKIMLTKCDLLSPGQLASSMTAVFEDAMGILSEMRQMKIHRNPQTESGHETEIKQESEEEVNSDEESGDDIEEYVDDPESLLLNFNDMKTLIIPISANTGANINGLWDELRSCARNNSVEHTGSNPDAVREHKKADLLRAQEMLRISRMAAARE